MASVVDTVDRRTVEEAARTAMTELAPAEVDLFPLVAEAFFAEGRLPARRRIDDRLGAGVDLVDVVVTISPVALMIANEAAKALIGEATKTSVKAVGRRVVGRYRAWRRRRKQTPETAPGVATENAELRARLIDLAVEHALPKEDAARLVDAVLEQLDDQGRDA